MTKIELPCSVITDLLPLYQDGLCSPESRELIEAHLNTCQDCRTLCRELPLPDPETIAVPDEAEAFRRVRKKTSRGKLLKGISVCSAVLLIGFAVLNCIWFPMKYFPYKKLCKGFEKNPDGGYQATDGKYRFGVKMPAYLGFQSGFLSVEALSNSENAARQPEADPQGATLFIWPKTGGETEFGIMLIQQQTGEWTSFSQFYISKDLEYLDERNTLPDDPPERTQDNHAFYEAHLDEVRGLMNAAESRWSDLFR